MRRRQCLITWLLCLSLTLALTSCSGSSVEEIGTGENETEEEESIVQVRLTVATSGNWEDVSRGILFEEYAEKLTEWTDGEVVIQLYDDAELGDDTQIMDGVIEGTLCIVNCVPSYMALKVPEAILMDVPAVFESVDEFNNLMETGYLEIMQEYFLENGLVLLSCVAFDMRQMTSNVPVTSPSDLEDLKLRTMDSEYQILFWETTGATVVPLAFSQVYTALQLGTIEGQENPLYYLESNQLGNVQDYVILTNHLPMISCYAMNQEQYDALEPEYQEALQRFFDEMMSDLVETTKDENVELLEWASEIKGMEILEITEDLTEQLEMARDVVFDALREDLGEDVVDEYLSYVELCGN